MMYITRPPDTQTKTGTFVTVANVKKQLNIESTFTDDDSYIQTLIDVAIESVEDDTNADFLDTANTYLINNDHGVIESTIRMYAAPLRLFAKVEIENNGTFTDVPSADYSIENGFHYFEIHFKKQITGTRTRITFQTGYTTGAYPKKLTQAAILKAADLYDTERSSYAAQVFDIKTYDRLIMKHIRKHW